ncbi:MAG: NADH-dependent [FeFe] hydrogenase, group A6 [Thermoleophilia bacterium]|nr:NADH-dependent [FeFe] hydrogenase, group A6 [Thermoleophilia bacterium]
MPDKSQLPTRRAPLSQLFQPDLEPQPVSPEAIGATVTITIDGTEVKVPIGTTILQAAKSIGVRIPTLCYHPDLEVAGICRMCVVEVEGQRTLQAACAYPITAPIKVNTYSRAVRMARRHVLDLMLSEHCGDCYSCKRNGNCELQALAEEYGVDSFRFGHVEVPVPVDDSSYSVVRDMNKCIRCRRCVRTCIDMQEVGVLEAINRSHQVEIATFMKKPLANVVCINCGQCINRCPTAALYAKDASDEVWKALDDPEKHVVIQTAPSPRAGMGEMFGLEPGTTVTYQMNTALRRMGFDKVFDTNFAADLTIIEEGTELILRLYKKLVEGDQTVALPQFTSCSPGWVKFCEHFYPEYLPNLSTAKSPQQMFGALIKTMYAQQAGIDPAKIVSVALMPCTAKKFECDRPEMNASGYKDVDFGLTTRELGRMFREAGIDLPNLPKSDFDDPFGGATGSGLIFGVTGGVMESALRTVLELVTGKKVESIYDHGDIIPVRGFDGIRYAELTIDEVGPVPDIIKHLVPNWDWLKGVTLKVAVAHGTANARKVMEDIKAGGHFSQCHFIEFMACPGGCLGGGGQPIPTSPEIRAARAQAIYNEEKTLSVRKSYENPAVVRTYQEFLTDGPCGHKSHKLLHTHYVARGKYIP